MNCDMLEASMPRLKVVRLPSDMPRVASRALADKAAALLRQHCRQQWAKTRPGTAPGSPIATQDVRVGWVDRVSAPRLVVTVRPAGCSWNEQGGGCVMCGHHLARTGWPAKTVELEEQWAGICDALSARQIPILCLYNGGSVLNPNELPFDALLSLCRRLSHLSFFRKLVIESRPEWVVPDRLRTMAGALRRGQTVVVGLGIESTNDDVRTVCLNKGLQWADYKPAMASTDWQTRFYLLFGAPFLTEAERIADTYRSLVSLHTLVPEEIHVEAATIQRGTLLSRLWRNECYNLPSLWSLLFLLRALPSDIRPFVGASVHFPMPDRFPTTCVFCDASVRAAFERYDGSLDPAAFDNLDCRCLDSWLQLVHETDTRPLEERVVAGLEEMVTMAAGTAQRANGVLGA